MMFYNSKNWVEFESNGKFVSNGVLNPMLFSNFLYILCNSIKKKTIEEQDNRNLRYKI